MRLSALLAAAALAAGPARAHAADDPARRTFDPDPSRPAALADGAFAVETAAAQARGTAHLELLLDYTRGLLALRQGDQSLGWLLPDRLSLHAIGSYALGPVEVGVHLPVALYQRSDMGLLTSRGYGGDLTRPVDAAALGDLRLVGKVPLLRRSSAPVDVAAALDVRLPTGDGSAFYSDGWLANPQLLAGRELGPVRLDASLGYVARRAGQFLQLVVQDGVSYGLGASVPLPRLGRASWRAVADVAGQLPRGLALGSRYRAPLSVRGGVRARLWRDLGFEAGAGTGLAWIGDAGYGRESFRVFAGLRWEHVAHEPGPAPGDRDGDGVPDDQDRCPDQPGPPELEGCPDRDGDGVPDIDDRCPDQPGPAQNDGCPPAPGPLVEIEAGHLSLKDAIFFDFDRDTIKPESDPMLDEIARLLQAHPELEVLRVEGHTDDRGTRPYNLDLSGRRARSVVRALVTRGVDARRLRSAGYGFDQPVASNATALGRAKNRRVEFIIVSERGR